MYLTRIPLYRPLDVPSLPAHMQQIHWRDAATEAEDALHAWLDLPVDVGVLLVDRATHALELAFDHLADREHPTVVLPLRTFRAVKDAVRSVCRPIDTAYNPACDCSWSMAGWVMREGCVYVPTTLGGMAIDDRWFRRGMSLVYDCAHTAYPDMFKSFCWTARRLAVLSFFPTKPLGAFGGGALIGYHDVLERIRPLAWPTEWTTACKFYYPQTVQSCGLINRIDNYRLVDNTVLRQMWAQTAGLIAREFNVDPRWHQGSEACLWSEAAPASPHLLSYWRMPILEKACRLANLETGAHYPRFAGDGADTDCISIPFHSTEILERLRAVTAEAQTAPPPPPQFPCPC